MSDTDDLVKLAETYLAFERCPGGRIVHKNYLCLHCGHDYTADDPDPPGCKKPTMERRKRMKRDKHGIWRECEWSL